jgi:methylenetetrahydrofolate dehydrogenase (NADP+)/methenyltetrahydrofolate cyclohydrolase
MIYNGKEASEQMKLTLRSNIASLGRSPILAIISATDHPSIQSFIKIKRTYAEEIGVTILERHFDTSATQEMIKHHIRDLVQEKSCDGIIVQLPLPPSFNAQEILDCIPSHVDVDVLTTHAYQKFEHEGSPLPTVVSAVAHILSDTKTDISSKNMVIVGRGKLVGAPVCTWAQQQRAHVTAIDKDTPADIRAELLKNADIIVAGSGSPHHITPEDISSDVVLIDAGTSEDAGVLSGDCDPLCATKARIFTPVPGGVGPLTVSYLFQNVILSAQRKR